MLWFTVLPDEYETPKLLLCKQNQCEMLYINLGVDNIYTVTGFRVPQVCDSGRPGLPIILSDIPNKSGIVTTEVSSVFIQLPHTA